MFEVQSVLLKEVVSQLRSHCDYENEEGVFGGICSGDTFLAVCRLYYLGEKWRCYHFVISSCRRNTVQ